MRKLKRAVGAALGRHQPGHHAGPAEPDIG
jgi:hypothetical protein